METKRKFADSAAALHPEKHPSKVAPCVFVREVNLVSKKSRVREVGLIISKQPRVREVGLITREVGLIISEKWKSLLGSYYFETASGVNGVAG